MFSTARANPSWNVRRYREGDENGIVDLLNLAWKTRFGKWHSLEYWHWKYKQNPAGPPIIWLAEENNQIIGHYGIIPVIMKIGNSYMTGSFSGDAATRPDHQGRGVFSSIVNKCSQDAAEKGFQITYGFANTNLGAIYKRYERRGHISFIKSVVKLLNSRPGPRKLKKRMISTNISNAIVPGPLKIERVDRFDQRIDELWDVLSRNFAIIVKRNEQYLNWRYAENPEKKYLIYQAEKDGDILGYCVLDEIQSQNQKLGAIVDILGFQDRFKTLERLLETAVQVLKLRGVDAVFSTISEEHRYIATFQKVGFVVHPRNQRALYAAINLRGSYLDERDIYSQALVLSQNSFFTEKDKWFMIFGDGAL